MRRGISTPRSLLCSLLNLTLLVTLVVSLALLSVPVRVLAADPIPISHKPLVDPPECEPSAARAQGNLCCDSAPNSGSSDACCHEQGVAAVDNDGCEAEPLCGGAAAMAGDDSPCALEFFGHVIALPDDPDNVGVWTIGERAVKVESTTRLDTRLAVFEIGARVLVQTAEVDGALVATSIEGMATHFMPMMQSQ